MLFCSVQAADIKWIIQLVQRLFICLALLVFAKAARPRAVSCRSQCWVVLMTPQGSTYQITGLQLHPGPSPGEHVQRHMPLQVCSRTKAGSCLCIISMPAAEGVDCTARSVACPADDRAAPWSSIHWSQRALGWWQPLQGMSR